MLRVVIAPDSFKGSLPAGRAAAALAAGWAAVRPGDRLTLLPQADGGEGTGGVMAMAPLMLGTAIAPDFWAASAAGASMVWISDVLTDTLSRSALGAVPG